MTLTDVLLKYNIYTGWFSATETCQWKIINMYVITHNEKGRFKVLNFDVFKSAKYSKCKKRSILEYTSGVKN